MKKTKMDNKGFSLVELIIVIAIMAILVAIIGSQLVPYIEKSRISKDLSTLDTVYSSLQTTIADWSVNNTPKPLDPAVSYSAVGTGLGDTGTTLQTSFEELVGIKNTEIAGRLASKAAANGGTVAVTCYYNPTTGEIAVIAGKLAVSNIQGSSSDGSWTAKTS